MEVAALGTTDPAMVHLRLGCAHLRDHIRERLLPEDFERQIAGNDTTIVRQRIVRRSHAAPAPNPRESRRVTESALLL
jgi:hypothetical protein